ncbi:hypothetical protein VF21_05507 [Pseudogymnoascus sp. 05NY08]|nr:hypothetical protein VF21_05507 [Pseudogymnoascus sp. 05NY08]
MGKRRLQKEKAPANASESKPITSKSSFAAPVHCGHFRRRCCCILSRRLLPEYHERSMARANAFSHRLSDYFDEDEDERYVDEEFDEYEEEEDGEYEVEDGEYDLVHIKEEARQIRSSISTMKRRQAAAAADGFILYDKGVGAVVGGKLDAAIRSEMRNAYPDMQAHEIEAKWKGMMEMLDCETRYVFLMHSQHSVPGLKEGIIAKIAPDLPWYSRTHTSLRTSIMEKSKSMRYNMLKSLQLHVEAATFGFMHHYVDITKSTDLGRFYMEEVYSHYCAKTKLFLDWQSDPEREVESPYTKARLVEFTELFPTIADFDRLERNDFHGLTTERIRNRPDKPVEAHGLVRGRDYFLSREAPPPSKRQRLGLGSGSVCG